MKIELRCEKEAETPKGPKRLRDLRAGEVFGFNNGVGCTRPCLVLLPTSSIRAALAGAPFGAIYTLDLASNSLVWFTDRALGVDESGNCYTYHPDAKVCLGEPKE